MILNISLFDIFFFSLFFSCYVFDLVFKLPFFPSSLKYVLKSKHYLGNKGKSIQFKLFKIIMLPASKKYFF